MGNDEVDRILHKTGNLFYLIGISYIMSFYFRFYAAFSPMIINNQFISTIICLLETILVTFILIQTKKLRILSPQPAIVQFHKLLNRGVLFMVLYFIIFFTVLIINLNPILAFSELICLPPFDAPPCFDSNEWIIALSPSIFGSPLFFGGLGYYINAWYAFDNVIYFYFGRCDQRVISHEIDDLRIIRIAYLLDIIIFISVLGSWTSFFVLFLNMIIVPLGIGIHFVGFFESGTYLKMLIKTKPKSI